MIEGIPLSIGQIGPSGLLAIVVVLIFTGRLLWHKVADQRAETLREENERLWVALTAQQEINRHYAETSRDTADSLETLLMLVRAIPRPNGQEKP